MHRFYADPSFSDDDHLFLSPEDARHALVVLRMKPGQTIELIHDSSLFEAQIVSVDNQQVSVRTIRKLSSTETSFSVTLFQGLPKSDKMDWIVQKATEIGVSQIVPLIMDRCMMKPDFRKDSHKIDRWRRIIREACKQSGRCAVPEILDPCTIFQLKDHLSLPALNVVPWEDTNGYGPRAFCQDHPNPVSLGILIGPEGGIDQKEISFLRSIGFIPVTLGKRILRTETAGLAAVSAFLGIYGEMDS